MPITLERANFGGTTSDITADVVAGFWKPKGGFLTFWDAQVGGSRYEDLVHNGQPTSNVTVPASGQIPVFQGPPGVVVMWAADGRAESAERVAIVAIVSATAAAEDAADRAEAAALTVHNIGTDNDTAVAGALTAGAATGAAARTTVADYVGDVGSALGTADDTTKINDALASPLLTRVSIAAGKVCNVAGTVSIPAGKTLTLRPGAKLLRTGSSTARVVTVNAGAVLEGGGVVEGTTASTVYVVGFTGHGGTVRGVTVQKGAYGIGSGNCNDLTIEDCTFTALTTYAWLNEGTSARPIFRNNRVLDSAQGVMFKSDTSDGVIAGNLISVTSGVGIELFGATVTRCTVSHNVVTGTPVLGISLAAATNCTVTGNTVVGHVQAGIENAEGASNNTITGNTVGAGSSTTQGVGITLTTSNPTTKPLTNVTVTGNTVADQTLHGIDCADGIAITVSGNSVRNSKTRGISFRGVAAGCSITGNTISYSGAAGILHLYVAGTDFLIAGNLIRAASAVAGEGVRLEGGSGHTVEGNVVENIATGVGCNNCGTTVFNNNRTKATTANSINLYNANSASSRVLTHIYTLAGGAATTNSAGATLTGPLVSA